MRLAICFVCSLCLTHGAVAATSRTVDALRADPPPTLDGRIDDPCWSTGEWASDFRLLGATEQPAVAQTHFKVRCDDDHLYLAARLDEPAMGELRAAVTERDGKVHRDDCLELLLDPNGDGTEYYHFTVNPLGTLYDSEVRQGGNVMTKEWDCDWEAAVGREAAAWTVECRIPLVELSLDAGSLKPWRFNVCRERVPGGGELSSFGPATGGFHQPTQFASLTVAHADLGRYLWLVREPFGQQVRPGEPGLVWSAKTHLTNQTGSFRFFRVVATLSVPGAPDSSGELVNGLDDRQASEYPLVLAVPATGNGSLRLELRDRGDGSLLAVRRYQLELVYTPLRITLDRPWYRQCIYATETVEQLSGVAEAALDEPALQAAELRLTLLGDGGVVAERTIAPAAATMPFELPVVNLPVGSYRLSARLQAGERVLCEAAVPLHRLAPARAEVRLDEHNVTRVDGEPFLPFGWFSIPEARYETVRQQGFNVLVDYNAQYRKVEEQLALLDRVAAAGLKVAFYPYPSSAFLTNEAWGSPVSESEERVLRERVRALKDHPAVLGWYMADEPELRPALPERTTRLREICAEEDPYHPCIMLNDTIEGIRKYVDGGDILMPDPYPLFLKGGHAARSIDRTTEYLAAIHEAGRGRRGVWVTPQAFNYGDYGRLNNRCPNLIELRNQMVQAICQRATGFIWYTYSQNDNYPALSIGMPFLAQEAQLLKPAILAPQTDRPLVVEPGDAKVIATQRSVGEIRYVFAVNVDPGPCEAAIALPDGPPLRWYVVSEGRAVAVEEGRLRDRFDGYGTHVYVTDQAAAGGLSLTDTLAQIAAADAARAKPGNLAFEDSGVKVTVSSRSTYGSTPDRVVDGVVGGMVWRDGTPGKYPDWLSLDWPAEVACGRVVVYSRNIAEAAVEIPEGDGWRRVADLVRTDNERLEASFAPLVTSRLRLTVTASSEPSVTVSEVEVYGR